MNIEPRNPTNSLQVCTAIVCDHSMALFGGKQQRKGSMFVKPVLQQEDGMSGGLSNKRGIKCHLRCVYL